MSRQSRLDSSGVLHHIIARGIERQKLFREDSDRELFLERLESGIERTQARCYAWVLMSNHFHLLLRTGTRPISELMRSVLTGHAVYFNKKYHRSGHVFQNRYKSVICQEEVYFMELVRYIHLNPVRAGIVHTLEELDTYGWSGHRAVVGNRDCGWQDTGSILERFGGGTEAVSGYREYIQDGFSMGKRPELLGGGLMRSAGGQEELERRRELREYHLGDERILGDSEFVEGLLKQADDQSQEREQLQRTGWTLRRLTEVVVQELSVSEEVLRSRSRRRDISRGKGIIAQIAYEELGISGAEIGRYLKLSSGAVSLTRQKWVKEAKAIYNNLIRKQRP